MIYDAIFKYYGNIPPVTKQNYVRDRILYSTQRYLIKRICTKILFPFYFRKTPIYSNNFDDSVVISLTSFPKRFPTLWLVIESLKRQTIKPYKIVLYLSNQEVCNKEDLPQSLLREEDDRFEIRFRDEKMRAHGKYHYAMCDFPSKNIVTVDDDIIYSPLMLEYLLKGH